MKKHEQMTRAELIRCIQAQETGAPAANSGFEHDRLAHELQVQQVTLETQNRELREAQMLLEGSRDRYADLYDFAPVGYVTLDDGGVICEINLTAAGMLGVERTRLVGVPFHLHVAEEDQAQFRDHLKKLSEERVTTELRLNRECGGTLSVVMQSVLVYGAEKKRFLCRTTLTDITTRQRAEQALRDNEARLRAVLDTAVEGVITIDDRGTIESFNHAAEELFGYPAREAIGQNVSLLMPSSHHELPDRGQAHTHDTGEWNIIGVGREISGRRKDGSTFPMELSVSEVHLDARRIFTGIVRGITRRKQAEKALHEERDLVSAVLETVGALVIVLDEAGRIVRFNRACEQITGYAAEEVMGKVIWDLLLPAEEVALVQSVFEQLRTSRLPSHFENNWLTKAGLRRLISWSNTVLTKPDGTVKHFIGTGIDITERRLVEEALRASEERFRHLVETTRIIAWEADVATWRFTYVGAWAVEVLGYPLKDWFQDRFWVDHIHPEDREAATKACAERMLREDDFELGYRMVRADGGTVWFHDIVHVVKGAKGPETIKGFLIDITERKQAEEALRASEERLRLVLEASEMGTFEIDLEKGKTHWNRVEYALLGIKPGEAPAHPETFFRFVHPDDIGRLRSKWDEAKRTGVLDTEFRIVRADGRERWLAGKGRFAIEGWAGGEAGGCATRFLGVNFDVTARKDAEQERQKFVSLANNSSDFIGMCDLDFNPFYVNAAGLRLVGLENLEAVGRAKMQDFFFPEDRLFLTKVFTPHLLHHGHNEVEIRFRHFQTGEAIWMICNVFNLFDAGGATVGWASVGHDITERRRLESELLEATDREQRRIGHDLHDGLGQQLTALEMQCFLLLEDLAASNLLDRREKLKEQTRRMSQALRECITISRSIARGLAPVALKTDGLMGALEQLAHSSSVPGKIECRFSCRHPVTVDNPQTAKHLYRMAQEAVNNALKHSRARRIFINLTHEQGMLRLQIKDDGQGLPKRRKIKSGMGLEVMRHRAHVIGAALEIDSRLGQGVSVTCALPLEHHEH